MTDPHINPETGVWDDNYFSRTQGGGGGGGTSTDSILQNALNSILGYVKTPPKPFDEVNPFFFDEALAKQASTAEYSPYYDEKLSDYVSDMDIKKSRSQEDFDATVGFLSGSKEYYTEVQRRILDQALRKSNEGYAGRGLFFSGARERDIRELKEANELDVGNYMREYKYKTGQLGTQLSRNVEDIEGNVEDYTRDIGREKEYAITSGVVQRKQEARDEYEMARQKYYDQAIYGA